jgi:hypothetical protein
MTELPEWYAVVRSTLAAPFRHSTMFASTLEAEAKGA